MILLLWKWLKTLLSYCGNHRERRKKDLKNVFITSLIHWFFFHFGKQSYRVFFSRKSKNSFAQKWPHDKVKVKTLRDLAKQVRRLSKIPFSIVVSESCAAASRISSFSSSVMERSLGSGWWTKPVKTGEGWLAENPSDTASAPWIVGP